MKDDQEDEVAVTGGSTESEPAVNDDVLRRVAGLRFEAITFVERIAEIVGTPIDLVLVVLHDEDPRRGESRDPEPPVWRPGSFSETAWIMRLRDPQWSKIGAGELPRRDGEESEGYHNRIYRLLHQPGIGPAPDTRGCRRHASSGQRLVGTDARNPCWAFLVAEIAGESRTPPLFVDAVAYKLVQMYDRKLPLAPDPASPYAVGAVQTAPQEVIRSAAEFYLRWLLRLNPRSGRFVDTFNTISLSRYEGADTSGGIAIWPGSEPSPSAYEIGVQFEQPVELEQHRRVRKVLEACRDGQQLLAARGGALGVDLFGIGCVGADSEGVFQVSFRGRGTWELARGDEVLMRVQNGEPRPPAPPLDETAEVNQLRATFPGLPPERLSELLRTLQTLSDSSRGGLIVITNEASSEATRLARQGTQTLPIALSEDRIDNLSRVDGAVLISDTGEIHAFGVILDGLVDAAGETSEQARGSRFNSAQCYVATRRREGPDVAVVAAVVSEDSNGRVDWSGLQDGRE